MQGLLTENINIHPDIILDLDDGATTGDYVCFNQYSRATYVMICGDGTAGSDVDFTLYQATSVGGGSAKILNALKTGRIFTKEAAAAFTALGQWVRESQDTADETFPTGGADDNGELMFIYAFELMETDLDVSGGFDCVRMDVDGDGATKLGCGFWIMSDPKSPTRPELMKDAQED